MTSELTGRILASLNREVLNELDLVGSISHPGENGRAREQIVARFIRRLIPNDFGVSTGFVFDAKGGISKQLDIVIYRAHHYPVFEVGGVRHFLVESVVAVIENKASIASTDALQAAFENVRSAKALDRTNGGTNVISTSTVLLTHADPNLVADQIFGAVVTERSLTSPVLKDEWLAFLSRYPERRMWPNFYADLRGCSGNYLKNVNPPQVGTPHEATHLGLTKPEAQNYVPPLVELAFELINHLRVARVIDFSPTSYLLGQSGEVSWWTIPAVVERSQ